MTTSIPPEDENIFFDLSKFKEKEKAENIFEKGIRHLGRSQARAAETIAGLPGDLQELSRWLFAKGLGAVIGDQEKAETISKLIPTPLSQAPSSKEIREKVTQPLTKEYLEPQTSGEEISDEIVSDITSLAIPTKGKVPFARSIIGALGGAAAKEGVKAIGGSPTQQELAKMGIMFLLGNLGRGSAKQYVRDLHKEADALIPENALMSSSKTEKNLLNAKNALLEGGVTPDKSPALGLMNQLLKKIKKGKGEISPREIRAFRNSVNEWRFSRKISNKGRFYLDRLDDVLNKSLLEYGKENPEFLKIYREAQLGSAGLKQSNKIARQISKHVDINKMSPEALILLGLHTNLSPSLAAKLGVTVAGAKAAQLAKRITTNKTLRTHYMNTLKAASEENWKAFSKNLNQLEQELKKEGKGIELEIVDFTEENP